MEFDKSQILGMLRSRGEEQKAQQAEKELPDKVDTDQHSGLLGKLGVNLQDLLGTGGLGGLGARALSRHRRIGVTNQRVRRTGAMLALVQVAGRTGRTGSVRAGD